MQGYIDAGNSSPSFLNLFRRMHKICDDGGLYISDVQYCNTKLTVVCSVFLDYCDKVIFKRKGI